MFAISTIEDVASTVAHDIVVGAKAVGSGIAKVEASAAPEVIEGLTSLIDPNAVKYEQLAFALLGPAASAAAAVGTAASQGFLNVPADEAMIAALAACWNDLKADVAAKGIVAAPVPAPAAQAAAN